MQGPDELFKPNKETPMPETTPTPPTTRPGYKTTEFWLTVAATLLGAAFASDLIPSDSKWAQVLGLAASVLSSLGYTVSRTLVKR
jgi:hypothetical protein